MKLRVWIPLLIALMGACALFFRGAYDEAKRNAIDGLTLRQRLHARQAALGVEQFFDHWTRTLKSLALVDDVARLDPHGEALLRSFYEASSDQINGITMTDEAGVIVFTAPHAASVGQDISRQKHMREILSRHEPVVSDVFRTVQGHDAVALHVPILDRDGYRGSLAITIRFRVIAKRFFEEIAVGKTGHAWVLSRDGTELYCRIPGHAGRSVFETNARSPSSLALAREMLAGKSGTMTHMYGEAIDREAPDTKKYTVYEPIRLRGTFWSVAIASAEDEILSPITAFRNRLIAVSSLLFLCGVLASFLGVRSWFVVRDARRRREEEEERRRLQEELQQAMKMESIGRLAGGVAHDFNNILTSIVGNSSLAMLELGPEHKVTPLLAQVEKAAMSAAALTRRLLAFARKQVVAPTVVDLNHLVESLRGMLARLIGEDVALRLELSEGLGAARVDVGQFEQVLLNLAVNARDAMPDGGTLTIATANAEGQVVLAVRDTGHGMDDAVRSRIFEPFFTTKPVGKGTGLGLSMVYGTVTQAGGAIEVDSEVGKGTEFRIRLPRCDEPPTVATRGSKPPDAQRGSETILIAEDDETVRDLLQRTLDGQGYRVLAARTGPEAIALAKKHDGRIDLLLTDVVMPGMGGRELADRLRAQRPELRVLFTSGYSDRNPARGGAGDTRESFIAKPTTPRELAARIREILGR
ncbi:MAG: response regulator [Proteobacteria bacterium]|jgi:signal transduction histidine kinase|nr:response regulator [Pseudomonadota bacterium]